MTAAVLITDAFALLAAVAGFALAFQQRRVRRLARRLQRRDPGRPLRTTGEGEDPVQYAMIIGGTMLMAFGILMFAFTTLYALLS